MGESELLEPAGKTELEGCLKAEEMLNIEHCILLFPNFNSRKSMFLYIFSENIC